jgi:acyl carrier protein
VYTLDEFAEFVASVMDLDMNISAESRLEDLPGWDSVNAMRLIMHIEKDFGVKLPIKEYFDARTLVDVFGLITRT